MEKSADVMSLTWLARFFGVPVQYFPYFYVLAVAVLLIILFLKGLALWRSARSGQTVWFWCILLINTFGILDIIYLLTHREKIEQPMVAATKN